MEPERTEWGKHIKCPSGIHNTAAIISPFIAKNNLCAAELCTLLLPFCAIMADNNLWVVARVRHFLALRVIGRSMWVQLANTALTHLSMAGKYIILVGIGKRREKRDPISKARV